ncbi:MAG TPA: tetratricopeptide repeat protein [Polyangia bacterium]|nr:tetratricopeptide repeat protein [Polyangia bacterium]
MAAHEQAIALRTATRLAAAEVACRRALALYTRAEGGTHPDVANALVELGQILEARDRLSAARKCHARALAILSAPAPRGEPPDPDIVRLRVRARVFGAGLDRALGAYAAADRGFAAALREATRAFGPRDLDVAGILNNLGVLRKYQGRYAEAVLFYKRALPVLKAAGDRGALATLYHNLGGIEHARGRYAAGEPHARASVVLREAELGRDHVAVAADVAALAALVEGRGRLEEAARLYERALRVFRRRLGGASAEVALNLSSLASLRQQQGRSSDAGRLFAQAVRLQERVFGRGHPEVAMTLHNLAFHEHAEGRLARAAFLYARAHRAFRSVLGPRHPHTRLSAANLRAVTAERRRADA